MSPAAERRALRLLLAGACIAAVLFLGAFAVIHAALQMYGSP